MPQDLFTVESYLQELNDLGQEIRQKVKDIEKELEEIQHLVKEAKSEGRSRKVGTMGFDSICWLSLLLHWA